MTTTTPIFQYQPRAGYETARYNLQQMSPEFDGILEAVEFAHDGQVRSNGDPFVVHPIRVAAAVMFHYRDVSMAKIALAHDVLEDSPQRWPEVEIHLRSVDADRVRKLTKLRGACGFEYEAQYMRGVASDPLVAAIKVEDRLDNVLDMGGWDQERRLRYVGKTLATFPRSMFETDRGRVLFQELTRQLYGR